MLDDLGDIILRSIGIRSDELNKKIIEEIGYTVFKDHFGGKDEYSNNFFGKIKKDKLRQFEEIVRTYFFRCREPHLDPILPIDYKLIIMFAIMESVIGGKRYVTLQEWVKSQISKNDKKIMTVDDWDKLCAEYNDLYGEQNSIKKFFKTFYLEEDLKYLCGGLRVYRGEKSENCEVVDIDGLINFIQSIRCLFIHEAEGIQIHSNDYYEEKARGYNSFSCETMTCVRNRVYLINDKKCNIDTILTGFERALIKYFLT